MPSSSMPPVSFTAGLPMSPRPQRHMLPVLNTNVSCHSASPSAMSEKTPAQVFIDNRQRRRDSLIFVNATVPLSPASSLSQDSQAPLDGLAPRKRNGFARLFCCFGREERARRRAMRPTEYEKVGEDLHWSEY